MAYLFERRQNWHRIIGLERRGAPFGTLMGRPLPDPTRLVDEDFLDELSRMLENDPRAAVPWRPGRKRP